MNKLMLLVLLALLPALAGCTASGRAEPSSQPVTAAAANGPCATPRRIVIGLDRTGSFQSTTTALNQLEAFLLQATCPGDELMVRWISEDSYAPAAAALTAHLPALDPPPPTPANPFRQRQHQASQAAWSARAAEFVAARQEVARQIRALPFAEAPATDIFGFFVKAGELQAGLPAARRLVVVLTDLEDTVGRQVPFDMTGAAVLVLAFEADDPIRTPITRQAWAGRLTAAGARRVLFYDPSESLNMHDLTTALSAQ